MPRTLRSGPDANTCAYFRRGALSDSVATHAARLLDGPMRGRGKFPPSLVERVVVEQIRDLRLWARRWAMQNGRRSAISSASWRALSSTAGPGRPVLPYLVEPLTEHSDNLAKLAVALVNTATLDDVRVLG
jgi:hypothetical protein